MNNYEVLYILESKLDDAAREAQIEKYAEVVKSSGGEVESINKWGMKKLAYPIDFKKDGFYVLMNFSSNFDLPKELERQMRISDEVVRFMVVRK